MTAPGTTSSTPDWGTCTLELHCPRCGYDLRGLPQPRCPECGLEFDWSRLIAATLEQLSSPLFEHQWRRRPVRAFFGTSVRALQPWRLWRETPIELTPRVGALLGFVALWAVLFTLVQVTIGAAQVLSDWWTNGTMRAGVAGILPLAGGTLQERVALAVPHLATTLLIGASVWAFVQIFQETMSRAHVRWGQVLRVVVFAWLPVMAWQTLSAAIDLGLTRISAGGPWITARRFGGSLFWGHDPFAGLVWCMFLPGEFVALCLAVASLCIGLDRYLRLRRGRWIGLVTGATIALGWLTLVFATYSYGHSTWMRLGIPRAWPGLWSVLGNLIRASIIR